jgi:glycosyltransferase involved in cell wall biosynthesis
MVLNRNTPQRTLAQQHPITESRNKAHCNCSWMWFLVVLGLFCSRSCLSVTFDLEWIMQGKSIISDGFFYEFLGLQNSLKQSFPSMRLTKSHFRAHLRESPISIDSDAYQSLYYDEQVAILDLISWNQRPSPLPIPLFNNQPQPNDRSFCHQLPSRNQRFVFDDLAKPIVLSVDNPSDCCQACVEEPLCIGWEFGCAPRDSPPQCRLKGQILKHRPFYLPPVLSESPLSNCYQGSLANSSTSRLAVPRFKIFHGTFCGYYNESIQMIKKEMNTIYIGRYMFEKGIDGIQKGLTGEEHQVLHCAHLMDEIWVPTEWNKNVFLDLSRVFKMHLPPVYVIHEAINHRLFSQPLVAETTGQCEAPTPTKPFQFLSIFKWEDRKGWSLLLRAYWTVFTKTDPVLLRIQTYRPHFLSGEKNVTDNLIKFARQVFGKELSELAAVHLGNPEYDDTPLGSRHYLLSSKLAYLNGQSPMLSREEVRELYLSSDAFVLPTRGEGWGLPIAEAMGLGLPVIVTNYSGPTAYADDSNSFLIPVELNLVTGRPMVLDDGYVIPSVTTLCEVMSLVYQNATLRREKGLSASRTMSQHFQSDSIVSSMVERMRDHANRRGWVS